MFNVNAGGRGLILLQLDMPDFVDFLYKALLFLRRGWGLGRWKMNGGKRGRRGGRKNCGWDVK